MVEKKREYNRVFSVAPIDWSRRNFRRVFVLLSEGFVVFGEGELDFEGEEVG